MEGEFTIVLANAQRLKAIPRKKTDIMDCKRIAKLLRYGLLPNSFIPPREIRELRDLNRTRRKLVGMMTSEENRLTKVLESSNIKLSSVVSKISGVSSMAMIRSLLEKDRLSKEEISQLAKGSLKKKVNLLEKALDGKLTDHHRFLLKMHMENLDHLARQMRISGMMLAALIGDYRTLLPASGLFMALLLLGEDQAARTIMAPAIFLVDTMIAFMGAPLFLYLF